MSNIISKDDYNKIHNFFKGLYKFKDQRLLSFVNIFSADDIAQEYILFRLQGKNYKTPKEFYSYKLRNAFLRKKFVSEIHIEEITPSDFVNYDVGDGNNCEKELMIIQNCDCKFSLSKDSGTNDEMTLDLCIINLGEFLKGFSYHIEKVLSHISLSENEKYYLKLAINDLLKDSQNVFNFTETELLNISSETLRKNNVEELFDLESRIKYLESNFLEFLTEDAVFLLKVLKSILTRDKTEYLLHPATKEEVGDLKQLPDNLINELTKKDIFKIKFFEKCLLAGKNQQEMKLIHFLNEDVATMLSYDEIIKLTENHLNKFKIEDLFKLSYKDLISIIETPEKNLLEYESFEELNLNKVI